MTQLKFDYGAYATVSYNPERRRNASPQPDRDGLFDVEGVTVICGRRQCNVEPVGELFLDVQFQKTKVRVTAFAQGKFDPVSVLTACTEARGSRAYKVDYETARPTHPEGIDELRVAAVVGAAGIRPYFPRRGKYTHARNGADRIASAGLPTWAFEQIIMGSEDRSDYRVRHGLRALEDAGLIEIKRGPRGGMAAARCTWTARAYLVAGPLAPADDEALGELA